MVGKLDQSQGFTSSTTGYLKVVTQEGGQGHLRNQKVLKTLSFQSGY